LPNLLQKTLKTMSPETTPEGHNYIKNPVSFMMTLDHDYDITNDEAAAGPGGGDRYCRRGAFPDP